MSKKRKTGLGFPLSDAEIELQKKLDDMEAKTKKRRGLDGEYSESEKAQIIISLIDQIEKGFSLRSACKVVAVGFSSVRRWRLDDPKIDKLFLNALNDGMDLKLDIAEDGLLVLLNRRDKDMIRYVLNTQGKKRGYVQNTNLGIVDGTLEDEDKKKRAESVQHKLFKALGCGIADKPKET